MVSERRAYECVSVRAPCVCVCEGARHQGMVGRGVLMCQKCLLCHGDLLSELHFTECSQIFISLKAPQRYEQACIHICHHCPFYSVRRFLSN